MTTNVTLYTRRNCHLCDDARAAIRASGVPVLLEEIDIDQDPELHARFTNDVPVIYVDGVEAFRHRVDPKEFAAYVQQPRIAAATPLAEERCEPCRGGTPPIRGEELRALHAQLGGSWQVIEEHHLSKDYRFPDFAQALAFTNRVGDVAEEEGHHPDVTLGWGRAGVTIWTHAIDGLSRADFVLAAKIDRIAARPERESSPHLPPAAHAFDFLHGRWRVEHRKLRERLAGCTDWLVTRGTCDCRPVLGGIGNIDSFRFDDDPFEGMTLRLFDLRREVWTIHWSDTRSGRLDPPLEGMFANGTGIFFGDDTHDGRAVRVRFIWRDLGPRASSWEQAFSADGGTSWETNWTMAFSR